jgi:hypothetical protein
MMVKKFDQNYDELGAYSDFKNAVTTRQPMGNKANVTKDRSEK